MNSIIEFFKQLFNINPQKKYEIEYTSDFFDLSGFSLTSILAERLTNLTITDNSINVLGDSTRAKFLKELVENFNNTKLKAVSEICLGTGDCIVKPYTDGKRIGFDIIPNDRFVVVDSIGDFIQSLLVKCEEFVKNADTYERWEYLKLAQTPDGKQYITITQVALKNKKQIPMASVSAWAGLKDNQVIPNVDRITIGRFKCPTLNRKNVNSVNGVPITFGNEQIVEQAKEVWKLYNKEMASSEKFIFADKRVFKARKRKLSDGTTEETPVLPSNKRNLVMTVNGSTQIDGSPLIHEFNPTIRETELSNGFKNELRMLELACGFDTGLLTESNSKYENLDATKKSIQNTFAFITNYRKVLEHGISDLIYAINVICNANNITPVGTYTLDFDWSDSYVENYAERFNQLLQGHSINAITTAEVRAWLTNKDVEIAEEELKKVVEETEDF